MDIKPVDPIVTATSSPLPKDQPNSAKKSQPTAITAYAKDQVKIDDSKSRQSSLNMMANLRAVSDEINAYAKVVRHTDTVLEKAGNQISLMKKSLDAIIKNFPPFPIESQERADLLNSYTSLRKEMEKLSVPQPVDVSTPALKQMFNDLFDNQGELKVAGAFDLPETIPPEASDRQIIGVIDKLDTAKMQLDRGRVELSSSIK